jgi:hypothetical protein
MDTNLNSQASPHGENSQNLVHRACNGVRDIPLNAPIPKFDLGCRQILSEAFDVEEMGNPARPMNEFEVEPSWVHPHCLENLTFPRVLGLAVDVRPAPIRETMRAEEIGDMHVQNNFQRQGIACAPRPHLLAGHHRQKRRNDHSRAPICPAFLSAIGAIIELISVQRPVAAPAINFFTGVTHKQRRIPIK